MRSLRTGIIPMNSISECYIRDEIGERHDMKEPFPFLLLRKRVQRMEYQVVRSIYDGMATREGCCLNYLFFFFFSCLLVRQPSRLIRQGLSY